MSFGPYTVNHKRKPQEGTTFDQLLVLIPSLSMSPSSLPGDHREGYWGVTRAVDLQPLTEV
jgi:hypothetical protein